MLPENEMFGLRDIRGMMLMVKWSLKTKHPLCSISNYSDANDIGTVHIFVFVFPFCWDTTMIDSGLHQESGDLFIVFDMAPITEFKR